MEGNNEARNEYSFTKKVWITAGIGLLAVVVLQLFKATFSVLLLVLAGVLIAVFFRGLSGLIKQKTGWNETLCVVISIVGTLLLLAGFFWLAGAKIQQQAVQLSDSLPQTIQHAKQQLSQNRIGRSILEKINSPESKSKLQSLASTFFRTTFGVLGDVYVVLFIGIYFTVSPSVYKKGMISLVPEKGKDKAKDVINKLGNNLKQWLKGKLFAMLVVAVLTSVGLLILGIPMWLVLALIAGILNFIPNFGPIIAMVPAVLIALMQGPATAGLVAGLYILVQLLESNFITPQVQEHLVSIPPALILIAQLFAGALSGGWGIILATPLMLIIMTLVKQLYTKPMQEEKKDE